MAYIPPHLRVKEVKVRKEFRQEFPQLAEPIKQESALDFSHIKDIVEPIIHPVEGLPHGWVNLRDPSTYIHPETDLTVLATRVILKMIGRWETWDYDHDIYVDYLEDTMEKYYSEVDSESDTDSISAEDPEYESDF